MLVNSNRASSNNNSSRSSRSSSRSSSSHSNASLTTATMEILPSTIIWTQTLESITLQININHVRVLLTEQCLKLSNRSKTISLPLFDRVYIDQCDIEQMIMTNKSSSSTNIIILTLEKECCDFWPHLLMQQTDEEIEAHLLEANFLVHIHHQQQLPQQSSTLITTSTTSTALTLYDTLDFESVINGQGEKTGLE